MKNWLLGIVLLISFSANSQILISLLLGDKLNSDKLEFGLDGGINFSSLRNLDEGEPAHYFNLGFYFDIMPFQNRRFKLNTGVIVKSTQGVQDLPVSPFGNQPLDSLLVGGGVKLYNNSFNMPIALKFMLDKNWYVRGGTQLGYITKARSVYSNDYLGSEVSYEEDIESSLAKFDIGGLLGIGYKLNAGMSISATVYMGLLDVAKAGDSGYYYQTAYFNVSIPIGAKSKPE